ncbi:DNA ligase D [Variovorax sp. HW608]|uniref:non-homologous end-joining DNA ligase n=1 Tax=Variovorax sp. HW608 TaxID=1034889 RepID=UPI00081FCEAB|nr:non-homologous end-joining DNA ligase [Variovorax sp. HW608]SCK20308.1 DNA ligase D [Variovorax sp. HW608]
MRTAKHRSKKVRSTVGRAALGRQATTQPSERLDEQDLCFDLSEGAVLQQAIASTRDLVHEAPPALKQRIWLYRAEGSAGATKRGNVTCLDSKSLNRAIQGVIQRHNLLGDDGLPDFGALQNAFDSARTKDITFHLFDLMHHDGLDLRQVALVERRALLKELLTDSPESIRFSEAFAGAPRDVLGSACKLGLEGIMGKKKDAPYVPGRSTDWIKLKCLQRQEFVVGGWTFQRGTKSGIGALLVGVHAANGDLLYSGNVGSGLSGKIVAQLLEKLAPLATTSSPFKGAAAEARGANWVKPQLIAEVAFTEWTKAGHVRHPVFRGLRVDKPAKTIVRELPHHLRPEPGSVVQHTLPAKFRVTNPERVIDPSTGITKIELVRFYGLVGPLILEHLKGRPVSLVRAPAGITGELFFQKHLDAGEIPGVRQLDPALSPGHGQLLEVATAQGLLSAAQLNVVEFHTWNAVKTAIGKPRTPER